VVQDYDLKVQEKPKEIKTNRLGLQAHELPASRIKQRDDEPKLIRDYFDNKQIKLTGTMIKNRRVGVWRKFNRKGQIVFETNYYNGKKNGLCKEWYPNGKLKMEGTYKNASRHGLVRFFNPDTQEVKSCGTYGEVEKLKLDDKKEMHIMLDER